MPQPQNRHGTLICTNCSDGQKSQHVYKSPANGLLVDATPTTCLNCGFVSTWGAVKPQ